MTIHRCNPTTDQCGGQACRAWQGRSSISVGAGCGVLTSSISNLGLFVEWDTNISACMAETPEAPTLWPDSGSGTWQEEQEMGPHMHAGQIEP